MTGARVKSGCNGRDCVKVCEHPGVPSPFLGYPHGQAGWEAYLRQSWTPQGKDPRRLELRVPPGESRLRARSCRALMRLPIGRDQS